MKVHIRLKLAQQLALVFGSMVLLATTIAWIGWDQIKVIQHHFDGVVDRTLPTLGALATSQERLLQLRVAELQHLTALTMPEKDREEDKVKSAATALDAAVRRYLDVSAELGDAALTAQLTAKVAAFHKNRVKFFQMSNSAAGAEIERAQEAREYFNGEGLQSFLDAYTATQQVQAHHTRQADAAKSMGAAALRSATENLLAAGAAIVVLSVLLAAFITRRVTQQLGGEPSQVAAIAKRIAQGDLYAPVPQRPPGDQSLMGVIGQMQAALREMVEELRETQTRLVAAARVAGMAEIATNVLHNVGNVLNSVNISAGVIGKQLRSSKVGGLARAVDLLEANAADLGLYLAHDPRGRLLPAYLRELSSTLQAENSSTSEELGALERSVDHIREIVAQQQSYAGTPRMVESLKVETLVSDALRINSGALTRHNIGVTRNLEELPPLPLDRHRVLQILVNLVSNAKHAMSGMTGGSPHLTLGAALVDGTALRLTVSDNGEGIAAENLTRIFAHGFTTRSNGHGFGLHSCILAAQEMGGRLTAHSDGPGKGSTFMLEIPIDASRVPR